MSAHIPPDALEIGEDGSTTLHEYFDASEQNLERLIRDIFENEWRRMTAGPWLRGAIFELTFDCKPDVRISKGLVTVDAGSWHFHLTIGGAEGENALDRVKTVAFYQWRAARDSIKGRSHGVRMWNGRGEQLITCFFPHVLLGDAPNVVGPVNWENLRSFYAFRSRYLGAPMPENLEQAGRAPLALVRR